MKTHLLLTEEPMEEANLAPLSDFFFIILMLVLLKASFILVQVDSSLAAGYSKDNSESRPTLAVLVQSPDEWLVMDQLVRSWQSRDIIEEALGNLDGDGLIVLSFAPDLSAAESWEIRARFQHEWKLPFVESQPLKTASATQ